MAGVYWTSRAKLIIKRGRKCELCGYSEEPMILNPHHKIPRCMGGSNKSDNLIILCPNCHAKEHLKTKKYKTLESVVEYWRTIKVNPKYMNEWREKNRDKLRMYNREYDRNVRSKNKSKEAMLPC